MDGTIYTGMKHDLVENYEKAAALFKQSPRSSYDTLLDSYYRLVCHRILNEPDGHEEGRGSPENPSQ